MNLPERIFRGTLLALLIVMACAQLAIRFRVPL